MYSLNIHDGTCGGLRRPGVLPGTIVGGSGILRGRDEGESTPDAVRLSRTETVEDRDGTEATLIELSRGQPLAVG